MRIFIFGKMMLCIICLGLLYFGLFPGAGLIDSLKLVALGTVAAISVSAFYPDIRGIRNGDQVAVVNDAGTPSLIGRPGTAAADGRKNQKIKVVLDNGSEVLGRVESYIGIISPPRIRVIYEEKLAPGQERPLEQ